MFSTFIIPACKIPRNEMMTTVTIKKISQKIVSRCVAVEKEPSSLILVLQIEANAQNRFLHLVEKGCIALLVVK